MNKVQIGNNQYCGPAALSVISGHTVDYCTKILGDIVGKPPDKIKGVFPVDLFKAADKLRIKHRELAVSSVTLFGTARMLYSLNKDATYLVTLPKHYIVIEIKESKIFICDNHTKEPLDLSNSARLSQKVERVWEVSVKPPAIFINNRVEVVVVPYSSEAAYYINVYKEYEDPEDNIKINKGLFRASGAEFKSIVDKLVEMCK